MKPAWKADDETFRFKTIFTLEVGIIKLNLIYDIKEDAVVSGSVIIKREDYIEVNVENLNLEHAKRRLKWSAVNIGSAILMRKTNSDGAVIQRQELVDNLATIYTMIEESVQKEKEQFRRKFMKGSTDE
jgi:hypothetical protein